MKLLLIPFIAIAIGFLAQYFLFKWIKYRQKKLPIINKHYKRITLLALATIFCLSSLAAKPGFIVTVNQTDVWAKTRVHYLSNSAAVDSIVHHYIGYAAPNFSIKQLLKTSRHFQFYTDTIHVYIERGTLVRKRNGRLKFKRLKKKRMQ